MVVNRRSFLKKSAAAGGVLLASNGGAAFAAATRSQRRPNILVVVVDQLRTPQWFPDQGKLDELLPNIARIRRAATSFENHYTASNMCVASRGVLLTGLYPHQTGCMLTKAIRDTSTLSPQFPTWGSMLRDDLGYETSWWGKWHLGPAPDKNPGGLEPYGFDGGTYPSPNGSPEEGVDKDPAITDQFVGWLDGAGPGPWCSTVSLVNPHDIQWWPRFTMQDQVHALGNYPFAAPPNAETAAQLRANKPRLQTALQETVNAACGPVPDDGPTAGPSWASMLQIYLWYQQQVDVQVGRVLDALNARPDLAANTIVIFTADHGEYCGSHGLRAKGGAVYEESIRVPLYVVDPRGRLSNGAASTRTQLTSSADFTPFLLTLATGSSSWRKQSRYAHLARRADIAAIASTPKTKGRPWVAHVTDETTVEELSYSHSFADEAPHHVAAVRTPSAKYAVYSPWRDGTIKVDTSDQDRELYDYRTHGGQLELDNLAGHGTSLEMSLSRLLEQTVIPHEVRAPLPRRLRAAQAEGLADFYARTAESGI